MGKQGNPTPAHHAVGTLSRGLRGLQSPPEPWHSLLPPTAACWLKFGSLALKDSCKYLVTSHVMSPLLCFWHGGRAACIRWEQALHPSRALCGIVAGPLTARQALCSSWCTHHCPRLSLPAGCAVEPCQPEAERASHASSLPALTPLGQPLAAGEAQICSSPCNSQRVFK